MLVLELVLMPRMSSRTGSGSAGNWSGNDFREKDVRMMDQKLRFDPSAEQKLRFVQRTIYRAKAAICSMEASASNSEMRSAILGYPTV